MRETTKMVLPATRPRNPFGKAAFTGNAGSHQKPHKALRAKVRQDLRSGRYDKTPSEPATRSIKVLVSGL